MKKKSSGWCLTDGFCLFVHFFPLHWFCLIVAGLAHAHARMGIHQQLGADMKATWASFAPNRASYCDLGNLGANAGRPWLKMKAWNPKNQRKSNAVATVECNNLEPT